MSLLSFCRLCPLCPLLQWSSKMADNEKYISEFVGQDYEFLAKRRPVPMYVREPAAGCNEQTGIMLLVHYWTGTYDMLFDACGDFCDRYNVVAITVNYLQSGHDDQDGIPYDLALIQTVDNLRAIYHVQNRLRAEGKPFDQRRIYVAGQSGGGIIALMCAKLAPCTFSCVFDLCGCSGLTDHHAFGMKEGGWSRDPSSPFYRTPAHQEIRDPGNLNHLRKQFEMNPKEKYIIVHSLDDTTCSVFDKIAVFRNMVEAGFRPSAVFVTPQDVDGQAVTMTDHPVGNPPLIYIKYGDEYFKPNGKFACRRDGETDFELHHRVSYDVTGGVWTMDYSDLPTISFRKA